MKLKNIVCTLLAALVALTLLAACDNASEYTVASKDETTGKADSAKDEDKDSEDEKDGEDEKETTKAAMTTTAAPETTTAENTAEPEETGDGASADDSYELTDYEKITFETAKTEVYVENGISFFPDTAISYNDSDNDIRYIIDGVTGKTLLAIPYSTGEWSNAFWDGFSSNLVKLRVKYDYYYVDATGKNVTAQLGSILGTAGYEDFYDSGYYGIQDMDENVIIEPMYNDIKINGDYYTFRLNKSNGVINQSGEVILKGLDTYYNDIVILPDNVIAGKELYSLPDGALIGEYEDIKELGDGRFMVSSSGDGTCSGLIIDSKGNVIFDIIDSSPVSAENCTYIRFNDFNNEKMWYQVSVGSNTGNSYYAFLSSSGKNLTGWRNAAENSVDFSYFNDTMVFLNKSTKKTTIYDYTGKKLNTFDGEYFGINGKSFYTKIDDGYKLVAANGTEIGDFSRYSYTHKNYDTIIVSDMDGMFYGLIVGDVLKYPCEYTDIDYADENQYLDLKKGGSITRVTGHSGVKTEVSM
jgi:hypothetical protein